jgi:hypothetical protein
MNTHSSFLSRVLSGAVFAAVLALFAAVSGPVLAAGPAPQAIDSGATSCAEPIALAEKMTNMPAQMLMSVALAESGTWDKANRAKIAWPWTVTSGSDGRYFKTKAEAIAWVKTLRSRGVTNIDVGCMQINLQHHANAFVNLEEAFDPVANVAYGAAFLMELFQEKKSWPVAIGLYHSATPALHYAYRNKVQLIWNEERRRAMDAQRQAQLAAYQAQQAKQKADYAAHVAETKRQAEEQQARIEARRKAGDVPFVVMAQQQAFASLPERN